MCTAGLMVSLVFNKGEGCHNVAITGYLGDKQQFTSHFSPAAARALAVDMVKMADSALKHDAEALASARNVVSQFRLQEGA